MFPHVLPEILAGRELFKNIMIKLLGFWDNFYENCFFVIFIVLFMRSLWRGFRSFH